MGYEELAKVQPVEELFTINAESANGIDPVARIAAGDVPGSLVILNGEPWRPRLGEVFIESDNQTGAHLDLHIRPQLVDEPGILNAVMRAALKQEGVSAAVVEIKKAEHESSISDLTLQRAGAIAIADHAFEFHLPVAA